ncbi:MAG TPA: hypothetical protein PLV19_06165 [Nitrosomonas sp.]|nr:hypothetical protein [Nitrosomonas sp.]HQX13741.1 hypothetical protein [Nitrosomonas sp.]HRB21972.1 hypothetical protein [Nitrosomonas sp.]HRB32420.1 hypothetical protein [Nitrosomonas sp.]HRB45259.1 hypothetical protein [Nitrosomonas sp.]
MSKELSGSEFLRDICIGGQKNPTLPNIPSLFRYFMEFRVLQEFNNLIFMALINY